MGYLYPILCRNNNGGSAGKGVVLIGIVLVIMVLTIIVLALVK